MPPYGNPGPSMGGGGSDAEMYEDGGSEEHKPEEQHEDDESPVQEVNASILGGKDIKPGEEFMVKLVSRHGDMCVVQYAPEKEEHEEGENEAGPEGASKMGAGGGMDSMME